MLLENKPSLYEVGDIFRQYGKQYKKKKKLPVNILKVMSAIENCRTRVLGGHVEECDQCGHKRISYNSCRNRHCPKCQSLARQRWIEERQSELLPVKYFHIVLTIPQELNEIALHNKKVVYDMLFSAGSETLLKLGEDEKHLGGEIGMIAVLHTWGQNLMEHPHLHCIVPGGGLSKEATKWLSPKKQGFFIHVNVISELFKKKFLYYLKRSYEKNELQYMDNLRARGSYKALLDCLYAKKWITYCKQPFGGPQQVINYLGRYTHRVAISNHRIRNIEECKVTFEYKDYRDCSKQKQMTLDADEFMRRFFLHVLPEGFCKIRYYGLLSSRNKKTKLARCRELLKVRQTVEAEVATNKSWKEILYELTGVDVDKCPKCKNGKMILIEKILPLCHAP